MKKLLIMLLSGISLLSLGITVEAEEINEKINISNELSEEEKVVISEVFTDKGFATLIVDELNKLNIPIEGINNEVSIKDLQQITRIDSVRYRTEIGSLEGIQILKNLEVLILYDTKISDITPIVKLPKLIYISISHSEIDDISPLVTYYSIRRGYTSVSLDNNKITDFSLIPEILDMKENNLIQGDLSLFNQQINFTDNTPIYKLPYSVDISHIKMHDGQPIRFGQTSSGYFEDGKYVIEKLPSFNTAAYIQFERQVSNGFGKVDYGLNHSRIELNNKLLPDELIYNFTINSHDEFDYYSPFKDIYTFSNPIKYKVVKDNLDTTKPGKYTIEYEVQKTRVTSDYIPFTVTVEVLPVAPESIYVEPIWTNLEVGDTYQLNSSVQPYNTSNKEIIWSSSNPKLVTVDNKGIVKAQGEGKAVITAKIKDSNISTSVDINVQNRDVYVEYSTHIQSYGWQHPQGNGMISGTTGEAKRLESIRINIPYEMDGGIKYQTHVQSKGWLNWSENGQSNGTEGEAKRLEAIKIMLTGNLAKKYDVYYRVHAEKFGWLGWAKNGEPAGTAGLAYRLEAIQIEIVPKSEGFNTENRAAFYELKTQPSIEYKTHVQSYGWQKNVVNGRTSGTVGQAKRLEGVVIDLKETNDFLSGDVNYQTHVEKYGWMKPVNGGDISGTTGEAKRLEAIRLNLTGQISKHYDIYYRVHVEKLGWLDWAKNGESAGTSGFAYRLEGMQIQLVKKNQPAPGATKQAYLMK